MEAIPIIISAVTAGAQVYSAVSGNGAPQTPPTFPGGQGNKGNVTSLLQQIRQQFPNLQEQVGGSVSPEYYQQIASMLAGGLGSNGSGATAYGQFQGNSPGGLTGSGGGLLGDNPYEVLSGGSGLTVNN